MYMVTRTILSRKFFEADSEEKVQELAWEDLEEDWVLLDSEYEIEKV